MFDAWSQAFGAAQRALFEGVAQPVVFAMGGGSLLADAYDATGWLLVGLAQMAVMLLLIVPLQRWRPVEPVTDRAAVRVDVVYTVIHRLGLFRLALFFGFGAWVAEAMGWLSLHGLSGWQLDEGLARLWPGFDDHGWAVFLMYLLVFDLFEYGLHRAQHTFGWWWALHAVHHSQRQMTVWSDSRNHLLDDAILDVLRVALAWLIGVPPGQFVAVVAVSQLVESLSHANLRLGFGLWGERLLVSPRFHRLHHAIGLGHESAGAGTLGGHNFGVLLPLWDILFGTARFDAVLHPTGIREQLPDAGACDYGRGFWAQQWLGLVRLFCRA